MSSTLLPCGLACTCNSSYSSQCLLPYTLGPYPLMCKFSPGYYPAARTSPSPRLVGVELNPGPPKKLIVKTVSLHPVKKKKSRLRVSRSKTPNIPGPVSDYIKTLTDPFEYPPMPLGYGTMTRTICSSAYLRSFITVNATDGSFAIFMQPSVTNMIMLNNAGVSALGDSSWSKFSASNSGSVIAQNDALRVVSGGIRVMALLPTSVPSGVLFAGSLPLQSQNQNVSFSATTLSSLANAELGIGSNGAKVILKPTELNSYQFFPEIGSGFVAQGGFSTSCAYIAGRDFPVGTKIWFESILNLEGFPKYGASGVGVSTDANDPSPGLTTYFPSLESAWNTISRVLGDSATMDAAAGLSSAIYPQATPAIQMVRSAFGRGSHTRNVVGQNVQNQGRQTTLVIEEMKEEVARPSNGWGLL